MQKKGKILFVNQEMTPYLAETPMGKLARTLPQEIQEKDFEVRSFMPRYGIINERRNQLHEVIRLSGLNIVIGEGDHSLIIKVASIPSARMQVYFIDNEDFFRRKAMVFDEGDAFFGDNDERMIFFSRGTLETIKKLRWQPNIVQCSGWFSFITPLLVKKAYHDDPLFADTKVVLVLNDEAFDAKFCPYFNQKLELDGVNSDEVASLSKAGYLDLVKFALNYTDGIIMGSKTIHPELKKYVESLNLPILPYSEESHVDLYADFYDTILAEK
ncbi:MAG: glycogen/starch synthase [Bacteroidales bacterium]